MGFFAPFMLWGATAAGIPIALHFFFRSRYRTIPWAAMKFLLTSIEQTSRRLRFQELLLLLARVAVLVLLAIALARPLAQATPGAGQGEAVDAVFVIDTSYSMGVREGTETRLDKAKAAALGLIDQLPAHSTVQVVTCADRAALLGPAAASNLDQARDIINNIELSSLATDFLPGVKEAAAALRRGQSPNKEFYLFSDMQKLGWEQQSQPLVEALKEVHEKAAVYLVRCGTASPKNISIVGVIPQGGAPRPDERAGFAVLVRNTGTEILRDLDVTLTVDGMDKSRETQAIKRLDPGQTKAVTLTGLMGKAGASVVTAAVKHDDLDDDNRFDLVVPVREHGRLLVIDGAPNEENPKLAPSYYLMHSLLPIEQNALDQWFLWPEVVSPRKATPRLLASQDLVILADVALEGDKERKAEGLSAEFLDHLNTFVRQGHGLLIFGGDNLNGPAYNRSLGNGLGLLPARLKGFHEADAKKPLLINRRSGLIPGLEQFQDDNYKQISEFVRFWKTVELEDPAAGRKDERDKKDNRDKERPRVILRYDDGKPLVVSRKVGAGEVILVAASPSPGWKPDSTDPTWSTLPLLSPMYIPLVHTLVGHLLQGQVKNNNTVAGQVMGWPVPEKDADRSFVLIRPDGEKVRLGLPEMSRGKPVLALNDLSQAGVYRVARVKSTPLPGASDEERNTLPEEKEDPGEPLAVVPDLRESANLETLSNEQLNEQLGFRPIHVIAGTDPNSYSGVERAGREWTPWILTAVLILAVGEALLAWVCGRAW
jgi:hypothetical protein